ncbi:MAG: choice-of-anchor L domain-containing protein [Cryomorphaceae bacterium]
MKFLKITILFLFTVTVADLSAQVDIIDTLTATELVNDFLLGEGVEAVPGSITFNGTQGDSVYIQIGLYRGADDLIEFDEGVVMATWDVNNSNSTGSDFITNSISNDPDLMALSNQNINDAAILEFDFTVISDSVKFNYVFASLEYDGFTCSQYNDAFGFFLSGPGLSGPFTDNAVNIARVPNSDPPLPVAINTINSGVPDDDSSFCINANPNWLEDVQYYIENTGTPPDEVIYPGMTVTLQAEEAVLCNEVYHIKLAIGDAVDFGVDSGVFLEAGSFSAIGEIVGSFSPVFASDSTDVTQEGYDSLAVGGCTNPIIELNRPACACYESIEFSFSEEGDAVLGVDFETVGEFPPVGFDVEGVESVQIEIATINELETDTLNVIFVVDYVTCQGFVGQTVIEIPIAPAPEIELSTEDITLVCPTDSVAISVSADNGLLPYVYDWEDIGEPGEFTDFGQFIETDIPGEDEGFVRQYIVRVRDKCDFKESTDTLLLTNNIPPPLQSSINLFEDPVCPNEPVDLEVSVQDGSPPYLFDWEDSANNSYEDQPFSSIVVEDINPVAIAFVDSLEVLSIITDQCGTIDTSRVTINYPEYDSLSVSFTPLFDNCPETAVQLESIVEGGAGDFTYTWSIDGESTFTDGFGPSTANTFINAGVDFNTFSLLVQDRCNRAGHDMFLGLSEDGSLLTTGFDTHEQTIPYIKLDPLPNIITPNGDNLNEVFVVPGINAFENASVLIYDRWGKLIYENNSYDAGTGEATVSQGFSADGFSDGTYFYIVNIDSGECVTQGNLEVVRGSE